MWSFTPVFLYVLWLLESFEKKRVHPAPLQHHDTPTYDYTIQISTTFELKRANVSFRRTSMVIYNHFYGQLL